MFHLSPHENIFTIALINIHYLYIVHRVEYEIVKRMVIECYSMSIIL